MSDGGARVRLSAVVVAQDVADTIGRCVESLSFADEVVVVDGGSADDTARVAAEAGARVVMNPWPGFAEQKRVAVGLARGEWVFLCDSDEVVTPRLARSVRAAVEAPGPAGYRVRRRNQFLGGWVRHGPWAFDRQTRLFRRDRVRISDARVHEAVLVDGPVGELDGDLLHFTHRTLAESVRRLNRYTTLEALDRVDRRRVGLLDVALAPAGVFARYYVVRGGWRDGARGFLLAAVTAVYRAVRYAKTYALQRGWEAPPDAAVGSAPGAAGEGGMGRSGRRPRARRGTALLAAAAIGAAPTAGRAGPVAAPSDARPGPPVLRVGLLSEPATLNPLAVVKSETHDIVHLLYLTLLEERLPGRGFAPRLARSWSYSADSLAIAFSLRRDARWEDGTPVTARDVVFTWRVQTDTTVAWPEAHTKSGIVGVEAPDSFTVVFRFDRRYPDQLTDANEGVVLPAHVLADAAPGALAAHPIGRRPVACGPYRLARWAPGRFIELERNPRYYEARDGVPRIPRVRFEFVPDMITLMARAAAGEVDLLESVPPDRVESIRRRNPRMRVYEYPSRRMEYVAWNTAREPFADAWVRRAFTEAIDRAEIIRTLWRGHAVEGTGPIHPLLWSADPGTAPLPFDPAAAGRLLDEAGWRDTDGDGVRERGGRELAFELVTNQGNQRRVDAATMVQSDLRRVGARVEVRTLEFSTLVQRLLSGEYDACVFGWKTSTRLDVANQWRSDAAPPNGYNIAFYRNARVDSLIEAARRAPDAARAWPLWARVHRIVYADQPYTFLAVPRDVTLVDGRFGDVQANAIGPLYRLRYWTVSSR